MERLLGLTYDDFCQCVVLPQGQFAQGGHDLDPGSVLADGGAGCAGACDSVRLRDARHQPAQLQPGVTEIFFHAATGRWDGIAPALADYQLEDELAALVDPEVARVLRAPGTVTIPFAGLTSSHA